MRDLRIDILRGISLIGIIYVNAMLMNSPAWMFEQGFAFAVTWHDNLFSGIVQDIFSRKTYPIFA